MIRVFAILLLLEALALLLGGLGMAWIRAPFCRVCHPARDLDAFFLLYWSLVGLEALLSRLAPASFGATEELMRQLGRQLAKTPRPRLLALVMALASALGEEVFFRGFLLSLLARALGPGPGLLLAALVFALFHPVPDRRAWLYPLYVLFAGVLFGLAYLLTGSLVPGILAHFLYNLKGFYEALDEGEMPRPPQYP